MTIATLDAMIAGLQPPRSIAKVATPALTGGRPHSLWYLGGFPSAGAAVANTAGGVNLSSSSAQVVGQIPHFDPGSGNAYLGRLLAQASQGGVLLLCDRLQQICGDSGGTALSVTATTSQTVTGGALPARDDAGSTNGAGVLCALEIAAAMGTPGAPSLTLGYTNSAGTSSRTAANIDAVTASSPLGAFYRFGLQAGDVGIKTVDSYQASATLTSGTISLVLYRILAELELSAPQMPNAMDALTGAMPRIFNGCVPFLVFVPSTTTTTAVNGHYLESQG